MDDTDFQVQGFLRFAASKRKQHVKEMDIAVEDFQESNVFDEEVYNAEDVEGLLQNLKETVRTTADKELENAYHTGALVVQLLLGQSAQHGMELKLDMDQLENESLLSRINGCNPSPSTFSVGHPLKAQRPGQLQQLPSLGASVDAVGENPAIVKERNQLRDEMAALKEKCRKFQNESTEAMRERTALRGEVLTLKNALERKDEELAALSNNLGGSQQDCVQNGKDGCASVDKTPSDTDNQEELESLRFRIKEAEADSSQLKTELNEAREKVKAQALEIRRAEESLNGKLTTSKQFSAIKAMMQQKSQEVVRLRRALAKHEPPKVADADSECTKSRGGEEEFDF
ncbi:hypothetical protein BSKO_09418 [Bryopsis sp. KO-2023]|nr:hypothetical protein BSKO_09418 [Bryopsis sp. KO-2023]